MTTDLTRPTGGRVHLAGSDGHSVLRSSLMALSAGLVWSLGALTARLSKHSDAWQYLLWRSVGILIVVEALSFVRRRSEPYRFAGGLRTAYSSGWPMIAASAALLATSAGFVYALKNTTAANAAFLSSITPLLAVVLARVVLGERLTRITIGALVLAFAGLLIMVTGDLGVGNMKGNISAVLSSFGFAAYAVILRSNKRADWSPALPGYASMMIPVGLAACVVQSRTVVPPLKDIALAMTHGGVIIITGMMIYNLASRRLPAVAMTVFAQTETVFVPVWIFLWFGERPRPTTLIGGVIILTAIVGKAILDAKPAAPTMHA